MQRLNLYILVFCAAEYSRNVVAVKNACPMTTAQKLKKQEILKRTRRHDYALFIPFNNKTSMDIFSFREGLLPLFEWLKGHSCITVPSSDMIINLCHYNDDDDLMGI
ncbi:hypothetical protein GQX74_013963 [Glossina fuscipes]|nr:hypothetical protein GQX74_013963 [Glossina fuscipes]